MTMRAAIFAALVAIGLSGCASSSDKIAASYVSPVLYENLSCRQIAEEATRVASRAREAAGAQDSQANKDAVLVGVTAVVFWPAAFFVGGDGKNATELARLKGEMDALEQASIHKNCGIQFRTGSPMAYAPER
jgi:outer membrane lipoprotein-sorting protein